MARQRNPKVFRQEKKLIKLEDMPGSICAWAGCDATFKGPMPEDWRWLLVYWRSRPAITTKLVKIANSRHCDRDAVLCPEHARELESQLKDLVRWADRPMSGEA